MTTIWVHFLGADGSQQTRKYKRLPAARRYAAEKAGDRPQIAKGYAISRDGVGQVAINPNGSGRLACEGISLDELFPKLKRAKR
jgi:hypothetical protein